MTHLPSIEVTPLPLSRRRDATIVDIRALEERELIGSIPGAYPFPLALFTQRPWLLMSVVSPEKPVVLACMSGRRSLEALTLAYDVGFSSVQSLSGGLLGWAEAGLPLVPPLVPGDDPPESIAALERELISCFIAERVEAALRTGDVDALQDNPRDRVVRLLDDLRGELSDPATRVDEAISRLGLFAWHSGHPLDQIAVNVERMRGWLCALQAR